MKTNQLTIQLINAQTQKGISGLRVEAWDKDAKVDDLLGQAISNELGLVQISFTEATYSDNNRDVAPDIYFKIYRGKILIKNTEKSVFMNVEADLKDVIITLTDKEMEIPVYTLLGKVELEGKASAVGMQIVVFQKGFRTEAQVGQALVNAKGNYNLSFHLEGEAPAYFAQVVPSGKKKSVYKSVLFVKPQKTEQLDISIADKVFTGTSRFTDIRKSLDGLVDKVPLNALDEDDISVLAAQSNKTVSEIDGFVQAAALAQKWEVPAEVAFAIMMKKEEGAKQLLTTEQGTFQQQLKSAVSEKIIESLSKKNLVTFADKLGLAHKKELLEFSPKGALPLNKILKGLDDKKQLAFAGIWSQHGTDTEHFWTGLSANKQFSSTELKQLEFSVQAANLLGDRLEVLENLQHNYEKGELNAIPDLLSLTDKDWLKLTAKDRNGKTIYYIEGKDKKKNKEAQQAFIAETQQLLEDTFPGQVFMKKLESNTLFDSTSLSKFKANNPEFEFGKQPIDQYLASNKGALKGIKDIDFANNLKTAQRVFSMGQGAGGAATSEKLLGLNFTSGSKIVTSGWSKFSSDYLSIGGSKKEAKVVFDNALNAQGLVQNLMAGMGTSAFGESNVTKFKEAEELEEKLPTIAAIFGEQSFCDCKHCRSVLSPAAYFVDILQFLEQKPTINSHLSKEDLAGISSDVEALWEHLIQVGFIDSDGKVITTDLETHEAQLIALGLLDENLNLIEGAVSTTDGLLAILAILVSTSNSTALSVLLKRRPDLTHILLDCQNTNSVMPYIDLVNEVLENAVLETAGRQEEVNYDRLQTRADKNQLLLAPEHINETVYQEILPAATDLYNLPYNYYGREANSWFAILNKERYELMSLLLSPESNWNETDIINEKLGINGTERSIFLIGLPLPSDWRRALTANHVALAKFLEVSQLTYKDLNELLSYKFVNPEARFKITFADADCNVETATLFFSGQGGLLLQRIVQLKRLAIKLGWKWSEVAAVLEIYCEEGISAGVLEEVATINQLAKKTGLSVDYALSLLGRIPAALYHEVFLEKDHLRPFEELFDLSGPESVIDLFTITEALSIALKLPGVELLALVEAFEITPVLNLESLSKLFGLTQLMKETRLGVKELILSHNIWAVNPTISAENILQFTQNTQALNEQKISPSELHFILFHSPEPNGVDIAALLTGLQSTLLNVEADSEGLSPDELIQRKEIELQLFLTEQTSIQSGRLIMLSQGLLINGLPLGEVLISEAIESEKKQSIERLLKVNFIIDKLKIGDDLLAFFISQAYGLDTWSVSAETPVPLTQWQELASAATLINKHSRGSVEAFITYLKSDEEGLDNVILDLSTLTGWTSRDLNFLVTHFSLSASRLREIEALSKLDTLFKATFPFSQPMVEIITWLAPQLNQEAVHSLQTAVKSQVSAQQWNERLRAPQDQLREERRDALLAYLLQEREELSGSNDVYARYLIDPEMSSCMLTSRIKQAISTVQLFIQRSLLNLERPDILITEVDRISWQNWLSMKNYRVWEAGRQVFMYPENWLDPVLRSDRTELFDELTETLLQGEITPATAEEAYLSYVQKVSEVSSLEIVSHLKNEKGNVYVLGRTHSSPNVYYFRSRQADRWSSWERLDLGISGDHAMVAELNNELFILWVELEQRSNEPENGTGFSNKAQLFWSKYKNGSWTNAKGANLPMEFGTSDAGFKSLLFRADPLDHNGLVTGYFTGIREGNTVSLTKLGSWQFDLGEGFVLKNLVQEDHPTFLLQVESGLELEFNRLVTTPSAFRSQAHPSLNYKGRPLFRNASNSPYRLSVQLERVGGNQFTLADDFFFQDNSRSLLFEKRGLTYKPVMFYHPFANTVFRLFNAHGIHQAFLQNPVINSKSFTGRFDNLTIKEEFIIKNYGSAIHGADGISELGSILPFDDDDIVSLADFLTEKGYVFNHRSDYYVREKMIDLAIEDFDLSGAPMDLNSHKETLFSILKESFNLHLIQFPFPNEEFDFDHQGAYAVYNWEVFYHIPLLIASHFQEQREFDAAQQWFHLIFNPIDANSAPDAMAAYWKVKPLLASYDENGIRSVRALLSDADESNEGLKSQIEAWRNNPFDPNLIASMRFNAYQKAVVMKYLDNLLAWGDALFSRDSIESINEASQLYLLITHLLGDKPGGIPGKEAVAANYHQLRSEGIDDFSNAQVLVEDRLGLGFVVRSHELLQKHLGAVSLDSNFREKAGQLVSLRDKLKPLSLGDSINLPGASLQDLPSSDAQRPAVILPGRITDDFPDFDFDQLVIIKSLYFCIPPNSQFLNHWDLVEDRLFKIRHCQDLTGLTRQLALFEPPIDPGQLVSAIGRGGSIADFLSLLSLPANQYRFTYLLAKAKEFTQEVRSLGNALLSVFEKQDSEAIARLRATHAVALLKAIKIQRKQQIEEAKRGIDVLNTSLEAAQERFDYYAGKQKLSEKENEQIGLLKKAYKMGEDAEIVDLFAKGAYAIPQVGVVGFEPSFEFGGQHVGAVYEALASYIRNIVDEHRFNASILSIAAGYDRRFEDWKFQERMAEQEIEQVTKQIELAELRLAMAEKDLENHELQIDQASSEEDFLKSKFTNGELYGWMKQQLSRLYFQSYKMAHKLSLQANQAMQYELHTSDVLIENNYWDSNYRGLLAGDNLFQDLQKMEVAYMNENRRELELTKHIGLSQINPRVLLDLKSRGEACFHLSEKLFNLDHPGHYLRRIKSVSISIPGVVGPYSSIPATLILESSRTRTSASLDASEVLEVHGSSAIATSSGQNDAGVFVLNFNEERYLPFEYAGIESNWKLQLPNEFRSFDYDTITDVVIHINYTARFGGDAFKARVSTQLREEMNLIKTQLTCGEEHGLHKVFDLARDFQNEFYQVVKTDQKPNFEISLHDRFPFLFRSQQINITGFSLELTMDSAGLEQSSQVHVDLPSASPMGLQALFGDEGKVTFEAQGTGNPLLEPGLVSIDLVALEDKKNSVERAILIVDYEVAPR